jgi:hypothetical protein
VRWLFIASVLLCLLLSALPLVWAVGRPWPGFFYNPFYTTNLFTDPTTPTYQAGLRTEDRVVQAGALPGQWPRIDQLHQQTALAAQQNRPLTLLWELGPVAGTIAIPVENLSWWRVLEKSGPLFVAGLMLAFLALSRKELPPERRCFAAFAALALLSAPDYFLNPGFGLESGFAPLAAPSWLTAPAKWSTYFYAPLWKIALTWGIYDLRFTIYDLLLVFLRSPSAKTPKESSIPPNRLTPDTRHPTPLFQSLIVNRQSSILLLVLLVFDLITYGYEALRTAIYNNPNYMIWHGRTAFWFEWGIFGLLLLVAQFRTKAFILHKVIALSGFLLFLFGFLIPLTFEVALPGPGPQWYALGFVGFFLATTLRA